MVRGELSGGAIRGVIGEEFPVFKMLKGMREEEVGMMGL